MKRSICLTLAIALGISLVGCKSVSEDEITSLTNVLDTNEIMAMDDLVASGTTEELGFQLDLPEVGEEIAVITTSMGTIKLRFFPEVAPKAVYNFKILSEAGYYDGVTFHRVIEDFMAQSGDPTATGSGGESVWGTSFEDEYSDALLNIAGAVSMANSGEDTNTSQFFINTNTTAPDWEYYELIYESYYLSDPETFVASYGETVNTDLLTQDIVDFYNEYGGNLSLDGALNTGESGYTVFAQVFEGLEIVEAITMVETDDSDKPLEDIIIESIEIVVYEG